MSDRSLQRRAIPRRHLHLAILAACALAACSEEEIVDTPIIRSVLTTRVEAPGGDRERELTGVVRSARQTDLSFRVQGQLVALGVKTGDLVDAGQLVAELDRTDLAIDLTEARAALTQGEAEVRNAEASYARARALYEREGIARTDLESARAAAESGRASVEAARQRVRAAQRQLGFARLVTPSAGAISAVPVELRENVSVGQTIAILQTGGPPEIAVAFPEVLIPFARVGLKVRASVEAIAGETFFGSITKVGVAPEEGGATYPVTVQLETDWERIRPGMAAEVRFVFAGSDAVTANIVVPASAVGEDRDGHFVFRVDPSGEAAGLFTAERVPVSVGKVEENGFAIADGLSGGERIVVAGLAKVQPGMTVRALDEGDWP